MPVIADSSRMAERYLWRTELFPGWREALVALLAPRRGDTVIDVECGSGLNLAALRTAVGRTGTVIALERSPRLLTLAAQQVQVSGWDNVELVNAAPETVRLPLRADAALFAAAPHALGCPAALSNVLAHLRPGAAVAAAGWQWPTRRWQWPLRAFLTTLGHTTGTDRGSDDGDDPVALRRPRARLAALTVDLRFTELGFGAGYLAHAYAPYLPDRARGLACPGHAGGAAPDPTPPARPSRSPAFLGPSPVAHRRPIGRVEHFHGQVRAVVDPLAALGPAMSAPQVRTLLSRAWRDHFGTRLPEPALSECAHALADGRPWIHTLWSDGW